MTLASNPFLELQKSMVEHSVAVSCHSLEGLARLRQLNLQALRASLEESGEQVAGTLQSLPLTPTGPDIANWIDPIREKTLAYFNHVQTIATETGTELAKEWEQQVAVSGKALQTMVASMAAEAPAGSYPWFSWDGGLAMAATGTQGFLPGLQPQVPAALHADQPSPRRSRVDDARKAS